MNWKAGKTTEVMNKQLVEYHHLLISHNIRKLNINEEEYFHFPSTSVNLTWLEQVFEKDYTQDCVKCQPIQWARTVRDVSIELPIPKLFICLFALFFYSSSYSFSWEGSTFGWRSKRPAADGGISGVMGKKERVREGMWIIDQRGWGESGRESRGERTRET